MLPSVVKGQIDFKGILTFCRNFRAAGIATLFLGGEPSAFQQLLQCSGRAFAHFLSTVTPPGPLTSKAQPFFDAVAAGDFEGASQIAHRSRRTWAQGEEYEEDYLFVTFCMQYFTSEAERTPGEALLQRYEAALQSSEDLRLPACQALRQGDSRAFNEAMRLFLAERGTRMDDRRMRAALSVEEAATEAALAVEGLALVRLAERAGLATEGDFLHIPSVAREGSAHSMAPDAWQRLWN
ncbi:Imm49 family immunity protein [Archangium violaceum]|uniref:Imm49 family immunity protein n=1 Tax=Archangium violaceum TaxID=83451 RepID=UPI0013632BA1|nr:Imm49 family immunity protein [Archangium violaceum]